MVSERLKKLAEKEELTEDEVMGLTLEECHRVLWWNLYLTGEEVEDSAPILYVRGSLWDCYACNACNGDCDYCPIAWRGVDCYAAESPYWKWLGAHSSEDRSKYAKIIAEMEWEEE